MRFRSAAAASFALFVAFATGAFFAPPALAATPAEIEAAKPIPIHTEVPIPTSPLEQGVDTYAGGVVRDVADYIQVVYNFLISIIGMVAAVMMIIGGFQYLTSAGDSTKIGAAKKRIADAIIGLVLALGSYALLNTINPALLQFKPLSAGLGQVTTELSFLPWCEDEPASANAQPLAATACGNIGSFTLPDGKGSSYCIYHGDCTAGPENQSPTCLQKPGLTTKDIQDLVKTNVTATVARCVPCWSITISGSRELGYADLPTACRAWMTTFNQFRSKTPNQNLWSYCGEAKDYDSGGNPSCIQVDINCHLANNNADGDATSSPNDPQCTGDDPRACGCNGYDDEPDESWSTQDKLIEDNSSPGDTAGELDDYPKHLAAVCSWNPCVDYSDDTITPHQVVSFGGVPVVASTVMTSKKAYANGCRAATGILFKAQRLIRHGDLSFDDCRNINK